MTNQKDSVKRFEPFVETIDGVDYALMKEMKLGDYTHHSDYATLEKENAELREENERLQEADRKLRISASAHSKKINEYWADAEERAETAETRVREALENIKEYNDMIPFHLDGTEDRHVRHYQRQIAAHCNEALATYKTGSGETPNDKENMGE